MTDDYGDNIDRLTKKLTKLVEQVQCQDGIKVGKCEYTTLGQGCSFPGTMSPDTHGPGRWYCRFHYQQLHGGLTEAEAAAKVRERRQAGKQLDWREAALQARMAELRANNDPMMVVADKLATGQGNREDKAAFLAMFRAKLKGLAADKEARNA